jgi:periplasmic protein TonB
MSYTQPAIGPRSVVAISFVVLIHAVMIYVLRNGLEHSQLMLASGPVFAELIDEPQIEPAQPPPPPPSFQPVHVDAVPEPEIAIDLPADSGQAITVPTSTPAPAPVARTAAAEIVPPRIDQNRSDMTPSYPPTSKRLGEQGRVLLLVHVTRNGKAAEVKLARSSGFERLDQAAVAHVQRAWRFVPARSGSETVDSWGEFAVTFRLIQQ